MSYLEINALKNFQNKLPLSIGTLGPSGTSSEAAAAHFLHNQLKQNDLKNKIYLFDTFDETLKALMANNIGYAIVPNAYERVNEFYINPRTELIGLFIHDTPSYGLAKRANERIPKENCKITTHLAPKNLAPFLLKKLDKKIDNYNVELANSTSVAAKLVADGEADLAITNEMAAKKYGLEMIAEYGPIKMSWTVFVKRKEV